MSDTSSGRFDSENDPVFERIGICHVCVHRTSAFRCKAFPSGIPVEIIVGDIDHTKPVPGDRGIQFSRRMV